ncbi:hypothetical protein D9758_004594 [Tetrapyrgos nigripes]|uniref:AAA+ ATPase domain-containing protein n=1 Tax=Tetrapyrgos nigripes TaxID=182062 RepID=A0A8H5H034_9AGAR|nr:hypothetical protein D9758_004594 [Tetrapyrgos nigripes]
MAVTGSRKMALEVALFLASQAAAWYTVKWMIDSFSPNGGKKAQMKTKQMEALKRLGHLELELDEYERTIANEIIHPDDIPTTFSDIGGLDPIIMSLRESIIYPLLYPHLFSSSSLLGPPKGVLLYGPPGCGKTMLAKALARESNATFINISASVLANKWFGESNKLVAGLFGLARKAQPSIIFIDEIDSFLRERSSGDHEVTAMIKAEFMTLWDGLLSTSDRILVLGATNRPNDIDAAFLRRMPKRFSVGLPDEGQRVKILNLLLKDTPLAPLSTSSPAFQVLASPTKARPNSLLSPSLSSSQPESQTSSSTSDSTSSSNYHRDQIIALLAHASAGMSGSDLKEACRAAAMVPVREGLRERMSKLSGPGSIHADGNADPDLSLGLDVSQTPFTTGKSQGESDLDKDMKSFIARSLRIEDFVTAAANEGGGSSVLAGNIVRMARGKLMDAEGVHDIDGAGDLEVPGEMLAVD